MNTETASAGESTQSVSIRPATKDDEAFLLRLFGSTRPEFSLLNLPESQLNALMSMQFNAQRQQYDDSYPAAENNIVLHDEDRIGRMLVDRGAREFTLIDIALLPEHRNAGVGAKLVQQLLDEAFAARKLVRLHVWKSNPALHLYQRLGFTVVTEQSTYLEMLFQPQV
jgi:ribosomal protein S18 acetylase RimI-like enzyme